MTTDDDSEHGDNGKDTGYDDAADGYDDDDGYGSEL